MEIRIKVGDILVNTKKCRIKMSEKVNQHSLCEVELVFDNVLTISDIERILDSQKISVYSVDRSNEMKTIFCGYFETYMVQEMNNINVVRLQAVSYTKILDVCFKSRSYQNVKETYYNVIKMALSDFTDSVIVNNAGDYMTGKPLLQYEETPWQFIIRVASYMGKGIFCVSEYEYPYVAIGADNFVLDVKVDVIDEKSGIDEKFFRLGGPSSEYTRDMFLYYEVMTSANLSIGKRIFYRGKEMLIQEKTVVYEDGKEWMFKYRFILPIAEMEPVRKNDKITGLSLVGEVLETKNEVIKVKFLIDQEQDVEEAYEYEWVPVSGDLMYCLPKVGTRVCVYFSSDDESSAMAINCVRTNGSNCDAMQKYTDRNFTTEHEKMIGLSDKTLNFSSQTSDQTINLSDDLLNFSSTKALVIVAQDDIEVKTNQCTAEAVEDINILQTGTDVCQESICDAIAVVSLSGDTDCFAEMDIIQVSGERNRNEMFDDNPEEGDLGELIGGVLARAAVGLVAVALVVGVLALASVATPILVAAAVGGCVAVAAVAISDINRGDCSAYGKYFCKGLAGAISGAIWGKFCPIGKYSTSFFKYVGQNMYAGGLSGLVDTTIEVGAGKILQVDEYQKIDAVEFTNMLGENAINSAIAGGIFGGLSYGARQIFSSTLYHLKGANIPTVQRFLQKMSGKLKWSSDKLISELKKVYGNMYSTNDLYRAFSKNPLLFFINTAEGVVMPGKVEAAIGSLFIGEAVEAANDEITEEDDAKYVEGYILRPATSN